MQTVWLQLQHTIASFNWTRT